MTHDIRKSGIPVLAYPECDASPISMFLMFRFNEARATASILLQSALFVNGHDDRQTFILQYDADNLRSGKSSLGPATIPLPQTRLDEVSREGNPQVRTLFLTLRETCPVWCPPSIEAATPKLGHETAFHQLATLARATQVSILFDYNWLHRDHRNIFQRLVDRPEQLTGFPVWRHYSKQYRREDWSIFNIAEDNATTDGEAPLGEQPPVYVESSKRARPVTPTPVSPPPKRALLSPYQDTHTSPTEKDSVATPSPKPLQTSSESSPRFPPLAALSPAPPQSTTASLHHSHTSFDLDATGQKPTLLAASSLGHPLPHSQPDLHSAVEQALSAILPDMLTTLLPRLLAASSPSPAPSLSSIASRLSTAAPHPTLSALGVSLGEHMTRRIETSVQSLYAHTLSHASHLRNEADAEFFEEREGERLAFERVAEEKLAEFKEQIEDVGEAVVERMGWRVDDLCAVAVEKVAKVAEEKPDLEREKEELRLDRVELGLEKEELRRDKQDLRTDREDLRRQKRALQREREILEDVRCTAKRTQGCEVRSARAGSAPV